MSGLVGNIREGSDDNVFLWEVRDETLRSHMISQLAKKRRRAKIGTVIAGLFGGMLLALWKSGIIPRGVENKDELLLLGIIGMFLCIMGWAGYLYADLKCKLVKSIEQQEKGKKETQGQLQVQLNDSPVPG